MNIIRMENVTVITQPVFIPNLNPDLHKLLCTVDKQVPIRDSMLTESKVYRVAFAGKRAEIAATVLEKGTKVNLTGHFYCAHFIADDGRHMAQPNFMVHKLELHEPVCTCRPEFDYQKVTTGKFGKARIWVHGKGLIEPPVSKSH